MILLIINIFCCINKSVIIILCIASSFFICYKKSADEKTLKINHPNTKHRGDEKYPIYKIKISDYEKRWNDLNLLSKKSLGEGKLDQKADDIRVK